MMPSSPGTGLHYCIAGERAVFLDVHADRYFCLPTRLERSFQRLLTGDRDILANDRSALTRVGILDPSGSIRAVAPLQFRTARQQLDPSPRPGRLIDASWAQWCAQSRLRRWSFERILAFERGRPPRGARAAACAQDDLAHLHAAFNIMAAWFGEADRCLARSLAFRALAFRRGYTPRLVLGVKLDPFAAHCWVQSGTRVDNDVIERTRLYTPILAI